MVVSLLKQVRKYKDWGFFHFRQSHTCAFFDIVEFLTSPPSDRLGKTVNSLFSPFNKFQVKQKIVLRSGMYIVFNRYNVIFKLLKKHSDFYTLIPYLEGMRSFTVKEDLILTAIKNKSYSILPPQTFLHQ